jgi:hypothetical protein
VIAYLTLDSNFFICDVSSIILLHHILFYCALYVSVSGSVDIRCANAEFSAVTLKDFFANIKWY